MWEIFQKILKDKITPDQLLLLYSVNERISVPQINPKSQIGFLITQGYIDQHNKDGKTSYTINRDGKSLIRKYDNYFIKAKKRTSNQLMGKNYTAAVQQYREMFPKKKLPSGKPARVNIKTLIDCFRWFFAEYDYTWSEIYKATQRYLNEYEDNNYMYMKTSQYYIVKTSQTKEKVSELADYCDMIREGTDDNMQHFKEKVV